MASLVTRKKKPKKKKKCPSGYRRNPKTGICNKKTEPKLDRSHATLRKYIQNKQIGEIRKWLKKEGVDLKKICDDDATDTEDESSDDEKRKKSPVKKGRLNISDSDEDSDSSDDDKKPKVKRTASSTDDDDSEEDLNSMIDLTLNSEEDEEEEVTCPIRTTIDKIAAAFVAEYAPWTTFGLRRHQYVRKRKFLNEKKKVEEKYIAYLWYFASDPNDPRGDALKSLLYKFENIDWIQASMAIKGKGIYDPLEIFEGLTVEDEEYFLNKIRREIYQAWNMDDSLINFHTGSKPKDVKNDILKLYVWEKNDKYIVAGEALAMETIFKHLPYSYARSSKYGKGYVRATQQKASDRNFKITYAKNPANSLEMRAFQRSINIINERFKNAVLSTTAPYLDKIDPNPLQQILGWDVEVNFPTKTRQIILSQKLEALGHCGPIRERGSINETWRYRFGIHSTDHPTSVDVLRYGLHAYSEKIFKEPISIYFWRNQWIGTILLQRFLNDDNVRIAYAGWGSKLGKTGHARVIYKSGPYICVLDPWIQSTRKHKAGFKVMEEVVKDHPKFSGVIFEQRPAEQARSEGSCAAISCSRALALVELGINRIGATAEIPTWCPVFVKMLYNKFGKHNAARQRATRGGVSSSSVRLKL